MRRLAAALLILLTLAQVAHAAQVQRVTFDPGGSLFGYIQRYQSMDKDGDTLVIDGMCVSACTLFLAFVSPAKVCATTRAILAFHSASAGGEHHSEATRLAWHLSPPRVRELLRRRGWDGNGPRNQHQELIYVEGEELGTIVRPCTTADFVIA